MIILKKSRDVIARQVLRTIAIGFATAALLCAALNLIELAGHFVVAALVAVSLDVLRLLYSGLPEKDRAAILSRSRVRRAAVLSSIAAITVSCAYWYAGWWLPFDRLPVPVRTLMVNHWRKMDFVPALFAQLLPGSWRSGFHQHFRGGLTYCFPGTFRWESMRYLRAAIPGYFIVFFAGLLLMHLIGASVRNLLRARRGATEAARG